MLRENKVTLYSVVSSHRFNCDIKLSKKDVLHEEFYNRFIDKFLKYLTLHEGNAINEYTKHEVIYLHDYFCENKIKNETLRYCFNKLISELNLYKNW